MVDLDFKDSVDRLKVSLEDYELRILDNSFIHPTCMMVKYQVDEDTSYTAYLLNYTPKIAEKTNEVDKIKK